MNRGAIFTRTFWQSYAIDFRRSGRDKRARKSMLYRTGFLVYVVAVLAYYGKTFYSFHDPVTAIALVVILLVVLAVVGAVRWSQHLEAQRQLSADIAAAPRDMVARLQQLAHALTALEERALGELWLLHHKLPEGHSVVTRRVSIGSLRERGIWDCLPVDVREWLMRPDGSWPGERIARVLASAEVLHTMLWALGLLAELRSLESLAKPVDFRKLARVLQRPAPGVRPTWDLRIERNNALQYLDRCYAENIHRHQVTAETPEQKQAVDSWMSDIASGDSPDALAGLETIAEVEQATLDQLVLAAAYRTQTLALIMSLLDGADDWQELADTVYAPFAAPHDAGEPIGTSAEL